MLPLPWLGPFPRCQGPHDIALKEAGGKKRSHLLTSTLEAKLMCNFQIYNSQKRTHCIYNVKTYFFTPTLETDLETFKAGDWKRCCQSRAIRACVTLVGVESSYLAVEVIKWNNSSNKSENVCTCLDLSSNCMCMGGNVIWLECESPFIATKQVMMNEYVVVTHLCPPDLMVIWSNRLQTTPSAFTDNHHKRWNGRQVFFLVLIVSWDVFTALLSECSRTRCMTHTRNQSYAIGCLP